MFAHYAMCARPRTIRKSKTDNPQNLYKLFSSDDSTCLSVIRRTSLKEARANTAAGIWRDRYDDDGHHIGFQIIAARELGYLDPSEQTTASITAHELVIYAGRVFPGGKSRTAHLTEDQRYGRPKRDNGRMPPAEDVVERTEAKVAAFAGPASRVSSEPGSPLGDRAVRVYPNS